MIIFMAIITVLAAYLIGSISSAVIISKVVFKKDIREEGSGNAGATNMLRVHGKKMGVLILVIDILKGVAAVGAAYILKGLTVRLGVNEDETFLRAFAPMAAFFVTVGHDFPLYFGFRGGKGVATSLGAVLMINPLITVVTIALAVAAIALTRYVSLGSIVGALVYIAGVIISAAVTKQYTAPELIFSFAISILLIVRHHANIVRLLHGNENKLGAKK